MPMIFHDFETQSNLDLPIVGTLKYVLDPSTRPLLWSWAVDDGPVKLWCPDLSNELVNDVWMFVYNRMAAHGPAPQELHALFKQPDTYAIAHNSGFDRAVWQQIATPEYGFPRIEIEQTLDAMSQAQASNLPGKLDWAGRKLGLGNKTVGGTGNMLRFARRQEPLPGSPADIDALMLKGMSRAKAIETAIAAWDLYLTYSVQDTDLLRAVWKTTRPLDAQEWQEYWVSERINDRGMLVDLDVCRGAAAYREEEALHVVEQIKEITDGQIAGPTFTAQINTWIYDRLPDDLAETMVKERDAEGYVTRLTGDKNVMARLIEDIQVSESPPEDAVLDLLEVLEYGRSSSAVKFEKMLNQTVDGRLFGSYVFDGAGQTGRFCVDALTLVDTPRGLKYIVDLKPSDEVITHLGRAGTVEALIYKGQETMYRVLGPDGAFVHATLGHRLLTEKGWLRLDECFEINSEGQGDLRQGCEPLSLARAEHGSDRRVLIPPGGLSARYLAGGTIPGGAETLAWSFPLKVQDGRGEPDVWDEDRGGTDTAARTRSSLERRGIHVRAPSDRGEVAWAAGSPSTLGGASHRRGQVEQRSGQSGHSNEARTPQAASHSTWQIIRLGERDVWDISVEGDRSYIAQGLIHHNSSRGVQIHNLPRDYLKNELDVLDLVAAGVPIERIREVGPVSATLAKLIRPTFVAPEGKLLVWGDWSAIEARVNPWLADTRDAEEAVLTPFRDGSDLYILNAEPIFNVPSDVILDRYMNGDPEAKAMRQAAKVACIAEGQLVLTDMGLVPIEDVTLDMRVWDGQSFVSHQGSVFKGFKDVYEYDGLIATLDHIVWTEEAGETRFGEAIRRGYHHVKSGAGRAPIRVGGDYLTRTSVPETEVGGVLCAVPLHGLRRREVHLPGEPAAREVERLSALHAAPANSEMAGPQIKRREGPLHQPQGPGVEMVRSARRRISVLVSAGSRVVGSREPGAAQGSGDRPNRQSYRALRSGQSSVGDRASAAIEQTRFEDRGELGLYPERMAVRAAHYASQITERIYPRGDHSAGARRGSRDAEGVAHYRGKVAVYDIANAGPFHRFTVSDALVHNCLALGFLGGVGALRAMAKGYGMRLSNEEAKRIVDGWRDRNRWARRFGDKAQEAAFAAMNNPMSLHKAGKLTYQYAPDLMGGTLVCFLPDRRPIVYPMAKIVKEEKFDKMQDAITYVHGMGRRSLWNGLQIQGGTQATAASILRQTLVRLEAGEPEAEIVGHTHDEVIGEVDATKASGFAKRLHDAMVTGFPWTEGLPLAAEISTAWWYTKNPPKTH